MPAPAHLAHDTPLGLESLVWRGDRLASPTAPGLPTGHPRLDAVLPGGGWPPGRPHRTPPAPSGGGRTGPPAAPPGPGCAPALGGLHRAPKPLYAPALAAAGVPLERLLVVEAASAAHARWAARQALASGSCDVVLLWLAEADLGALRRLQLTAEENATPLFLLRPDSLARQPSPAALRLALAARPGGVEVHILKRRGPPLLHPIPVDLPGPAGSASTASGKDPSAGPQPVSAPPPLQPALRAGPASVHALVRPPPSRPGPAGIHPGRH